MHLEINHFSIDILMLLENYHQKIPYFFKFGILGLLQ